MIIINNYLRTFFKHSFFSCLDFKKKTLVASLEIWSNHCKITKLKFFTTEWRRTRWKDLCVEEQDSINFVLEEIHHSTVYWRDDEEEKNLSALQSVVCARRFSSADLKYKSTDLCVNCWQSYKKLENKLKVHSFQVD